MEIDFFAQLVIYLSIRAIAEEPQLWKIYNIDDKERLLFSHDDFENPDRSQIFNDLSQLSSDVSELAEELKKICKYTDFSKIPSLDKILTPPVQQWNPRTNSSSIPTQSPTPTPAPTTKSWNPANSRSTATKSPTPTPTPSTTSWNPGNSRSTKTKSPTAAQSTGQKAVWNPSCSPLTSNNSSILNQQKSARKIKPNAKQKKLKTVQSVSAGKIVLIETIAFVSTITAIALGGICYYQYETINELRWQIQYQQRQKNNSNADTEKLQSQVEQLRNQRDELLSRVEHLANKRDELQSRVNQLTKNTDVNFCNKTSSTTIDTALAYWNGEGLLSRGWWTIEVGECRKISVTQNYQGYLYVYGMHNKGESEWGSGNYSFCVDVVNAFDISKSDKVSCSKENQKKVKMTEFSVSPGTNNWSFKD